MGGGEGGGEREGGREGGGEREGGREGGGEREGGRGRREGDKLLVLL